jgi:chorismate mutase
VTSARKKSLLAGSVLGLLVAVVLLWRSSAGERTDSRSPSALGGARVAQDSAGPRAAQFGSPAATAAVPVPFENFGLPLAPSGDYEMAISDSELQAIVEARYGPMVRSLALAPAAGARLFELLTERQHAAIDVANAAMVAGLNPIRDLAVIQQAIALAEADVDADIAREHGASVVTACRDFESTRTERNTVDQLTRAATDLGDPLTAAQQQRLIVVLRNTAAPAPDDINSAIFGRLNGRIPLGTKALAAAAPELSPRQLEALRQLARASASDRTTANSLR